MRTGAEIKVGAITLLALALLAVYVFQIRGYRLAGAAYSVCVTFEDARGLLPRDPVRMAGVRIGEVDVVEINRDELNADVTLSIDRRYELYDDYKFQIATSGLIQERFVEVIPTEKTPYSQKLVSGACVEGVVAPGLSDLVAGGSEVLENLNRTSRRLNVVLSDQEILTGLQRALRDFSDAAEAAAELASSTTELTAASQPQILAALQSTRRSADDLEAMTHALRGRLAEGPLLADLEGAVSSARAAADNAAQITDSLAEFTADRTVHHKLRETVTAAHEAAQSAKQVGENLEVLSAELRKAAPSVPRVAEEAEGLADTAATLRERLKPPEIDASFDVLYSSEADRWFSSGRLDFQTAEPNFLRLGIDDIGEESNVNVQIGERQERTTIRYGLVRSRLGVGVDVRLPHSSTLSLDLFDPNDLRADILADVPLIIGRSDWRLLIGARNLGEDELVIGGIRLLR